MSGFLWFLTPAALLLLACLLEDVPAIGRLADKLIDTFAGSGGFPRE